MRKIVTEGSIKKYLYLLDVDYLFVRKLERREGFEDLKDYIVSINNLEESFQYEDGKFYLDCTNHELQTEQAEEFQRVTKAMEEEGKTEQEIKEFIAGKGTQFIDKVEYIIDCEGLQKRIDLAISKLS